MQTGPFIVAVTLFLYSGGSRFKPESEHWLSWLRFLWGFSRRPCLDPMSVRYIYVGQSDSGTGFYLINLVCLSLSASASSYDSWTTTASFLILSSFIRILRLYTNSVVRKKQRILGSLFIRILVCSLLLVQVCVSRASASIRTWAVRIQCILLSRWRVVWFGQCRILDLMFSIARMLDHEIEVFLFLYFRLLQQQTRIFPFHITRHSGNSLRHLFPVGILVYILRRGRTVKWRRMTLTKSLFLFQ